MGASPQGGKRAGRKASMSALAKRAVIDSFAKLTPREQAKNPVMLMVYISAILTLGLFALSLFGIADAHPGFIFAVSAVLWLTVLFANFAEALAEGRGKAQADSLRAAKRDIADVRLAALGDGTTNDAANAKSKSAKSKSGHNNATMSRYAHREKFVKDMKKDYTIVAPQMSPIHFSLVESVIRSGGYKFDILKHASREDVETGLKYVNNDACYPAIMVIGQLIDAILEGKYDPDKVCLAITQTGGMCRATNYFGLIRKALVDAGYPQIPVIAISTQGIEDNPGFTATPALLHRAIKALIVGDLLMKCLYRVRPYEVTPGSANQLYKTWDTIVREALEHHGFSKTAAKTPWLKRRYLPYPVLAREIVKSFDALPLKDVPRKVRVGVVGEILVKYQPDANNHVVDVIESQDCEAVVPGIMEFMTTRPYISDWNEHYLGMGGSKIGYALMRKGLDLYNAPVREAIDLAHGKFSQDLPMPELVKKADEVTSVGVQAGEGWLLTAEILELIESGCPNVVCAQPFACLPNHVTGRGMFGKIRRLHPEANIVSIDYDPGASEANQLNRIKLFMTVAHSRIPQEAQGDHAPASLNESVAQLAGRLRDNLKGKLENTIGGSGNSGDEVTNLA